MPRRSVVCVAIAALYAQLAAPSAHAQTSPANEPLVQQSDLVYSGAFRLPTAPLEENSFAYGGTALTYNPLNNSLFAVGHNWYQKVAEVSIPAVTNAASLSALARAPLRQPFVDVLEGQMDRIGSGTQLVGGMLVSGGSLIVSAYLYYDASVSQRLSHFRSGLELGRVGDLQGPYQVGTAGAGFVSGYMTPIPAEWRSAFGGDALTGNCCLSIISRTSLGPAASVFTAADVGVGAVVPATQVLGYPITHPTLGSCDTEHALFNCSSTMGGMVFPDGTRSVLFFGRLALGSYCYGTGGASGGQCVDPSDGSKGPHMYPYTYHVWAYDALDLLAVKNGQKQPWDVRPYKTWSFDLPFQDDARRLFGATYDPATRRIFVSQDHGDGTAALIHVFTIAGSSGAPRRPDPPSGLTASVSGSVVTLGWNAPALPDVTHYIVEAGSMPNAADIASFATATAATSLTLSSVRDGTYYVRVRAVGAGGTSDPSADTSVIVGASCTGAPERPTLNAQMAGRTVTLSWTASLGAVSYNLQAGSAPARSDLVDLHTGNAGTTFVVTASPGTYYVRLRAENACGLSAPSNEAAVVVR